MTELKIETETEVDEYSSSSNEYSSENETSSLSEKDREDQVIQEVNWTYDRGLHNEANFDLLKYTYDKVDKNLRLTTELNEQFHSFLNRDDSDSESESDDDDDEHNKNVKKDKIDNALFRFTMCLVAFYMIFFVVTISYMQPSQEQITI